MYVMTASTGWNMLSLPYHVTNPYYLNIYPSAIVGTLYGFNGSYYATDSLQTCAGYWLRFAAEETINITGFPIDSCTITLAPGWNMIGGLSCDVPLSNINDPGGIIIPGTLFGFNGAYVSADTIKQGNGYWLRTNAAGTITLTCGSNLARTFASGQQNTIFPDPGSLSTLEIRDALGIGQSLFFNVQLEDSSLLESYRLPPVPPVGTGSFDARFEGDYRLTENKQATIYLQASQYPVIIRPANLPAIGDLFSGEGYQYALQELVNGEVTATHVLKEDQTLEIKDSRVNSLRLVKNNVVPLEFMVLQNYPNPFNPETKIRYAIPRADKVEIVIYNVLGQRVKTLVSQPQEAGYYTAVWDGTNEYGNKVGSGIYFYRVSSGKQSAIKKMLLIK
jgi:hypothetical protein